MIANLEPAAAKANAPMYHLKVVLYATKPLIWRRVQVPGNANLGWLHAVLQVAMGWTNSHLHQFIIGEARYSDPRSTEDQGFGVEPDRNEAKATLVETVPPPGAPFSYDYDLGDSWEHLITVEKILPPDPAWAGIALCLDGARACPPEDCGGVSGFADLLKTIKNPRHKEYQSMMEWLGGKFDPVKFDRDLVNTCLRKLKWPRTTESQLRQVLMARDDS